MKWYFFALLALVFGACTNETAEPSPYGDLLSQPPYSTLSDSIKADKTRSELYFNRAVLLNKNNLPEPALADFQKAWSLEKQERYALGISNMLLERKPDSAISFLNLALKELPQSLFMQLVLARAYDAEGQTEDALVVCDKILQAEPNQVNTLVLKSEILEKKNDLPAMIESLEKAYQLLPGNLEIANKLAYQYAENKDSRALVLADSLLQKDSLHLHSEPFYIKGNYYANINQKAKAIQLFDQTIQRDHRALNAYIEKGKILFDQKKLAEALKTFQLANTVNPAFADAWYWIGRCQEAAGATEEALASYDRAYGLDKTFTEAKEAVDKLEKKRS